MNRIDSAPMIAIRYRALLLPLALLCACKSSPSKDDVLSDEQRGELRRIVDENMSKLTGTMQLTATQRDNIAPYMKKAADQLYAAARKYHRDPNPKALQRYQSETRRIGNELRPNLKPFMTDAQLNNFMVVLDRTLQSVSAVKIARGEQ
jgi:hypothetical protein